MSAPDLPGAIDCVALFDPLHTALLDLLESLDDSAWWENTVCHPWTVHDLAIHLYGADVNILAGDRDGFRGPPGVAPLDLGTWDALLAFINGRNRDWVDANRRISPTLLIDLLRLTGDHLPSYWPSVDLAAMRSPVDWVGADPAPTWLHIAREYTERWVHQQQIRDAVGAPGMADQRYLQPVVDAFALALPRSLKDVSAAVGDTARLNIVGEASGTWLVRATTSGWEWAMASQDSPVATVTIPADTFWRVASRTTGPDTALQNAFIEGDSTIGRAIVHMVSMIVG